MPHTNPRLFFDINRFANYTAFISHQLELRRNLLSASAGCMSVGRKSAILPDRRCSVDSFLEAISHTTGDRVSDRSFPSFGKQIPTAMLIWSVRCVTSGSRDLVVLKLIL